MALIRLRAFSEVLGMAFQAAVALPEGKKGPHPVLWLLHGAGEDYMSWFRNTGIERLAVRRGLAVVCPDAQLSMYEDMEHGQRFFMHIADELPALLSRMLPLSGARADNFVAGLSMGGTGALKLAIRRPEKYAAVGCLSAGYNNYRFHEPQPGTIREKRYRLVYGPEGPDGADEALLKEVERVAQSGAAPRIYHACGTEDMLLRNARIAKELFEGFAGDPFSYTYRERLGRHNWDFWGDCVPEMLDFFLKK